MAITNIQYKGLLEALDYYKSSRSTQEDFDNYDVIEKICINGADAEKLDVINDYLTDIERPNVVDSIAAQQDALTKSQNRLILIDDQLGV